MKKTILFLVILMGITSHAQVTVNTSPDPLIACDINNNGLGTFDLT